MFYKPYVLPTLPTSLLAIPFFKSHDNKILVPHPMRQLILFAKDICPYLFIKLLFTLQDLLQTLFLKEQHELQSEMTYWVQILTLTLSLKLWAS
jgi:hypothetical protein